MPINLDAILNLKMKKISKCILLIVTLLSLVCLIFYKTQYDKLYNVLQVLEFFGSQDGSTQDPFKRLKYVIQSLVANDLGQGNSGRVKFTGFFIPSLCFYTQETGHREFPALTC